MFTNSCMTLAMDTAWGLGAEIFIDIKETLIAQCSFYVA